MSRSGHPSPSRLAHLLRAYDLNGPRISDPTEGTDPMTETIITQRLLNEAVKKLRRDLKVFAACEVNTVRRRIDRLEAAHQMPRLPDDYLDHHAAAMAAQLDPEADDE